MTISQALEFIIEMMLTFHDSSENPQSLDWTRRGASGDETYLQRGAYGKNITRRAKKQ